MGILKKIGFASLIIAAYFSGQHKGYNAGYNDSQNLKVAELDKAVREAIKDCNQKLQHCNYRLDIEESYRK
jgi:hypothetical protein